MRFARFAFSFAAVACLFGCSDPVTPTPRGAINVSFAPPTGGGCNVMVHQTKIGDVDDSHRNVVVTDGEGAHISCSVTGSGTFAVDASARDDHDNYLEISLGAVSGSATLANPAHGTAAYSSQPTAGNPYVSPDGTPCNFYFIPKSGEGVDAGKIWVAFNCPKIVYGTNTCAIHGDAIFEDCDDGSSSN